MKTYSRIIFLGFSFLLFAGCVTSPKEQTSTGYVPLKDRPLSSKEYWKQRDEQDRLEQQIEERNRPR